MILLSRQIYRFVDVLNPTNPVKLGYLELPVSYVMDIEVNNGYIYLGGLEGLYIFQYGYNADGLVTDMHGIPVSGVELSTNNGLVTTSGSSGLYQFTELSPGSETVTPNKSGFAFYPSARVITIPPDAAGINFTLVAAAVQTTLLPDTDAQLVYTDTQGLPTRFEFPSGSVAVTSKVTVTPTLASGGGEMAFARHAFQLGVTLPGDGGQVMSFNVPVTTTIHYSDNDIDTVSDLNQLALYWWGEIGWLPAQETCLENPQPGQALGRHWLMVSICSTGKYALFGPTEAVYLPFMRVELE